MQLSQYGKAFAALRNAASTLCLGTDWSSPLTRVECWPNVVSQDPAIGFDVTLDCG